MLLMVILIWVGNVQQWHPDKWTKNPLLFGKAKRKFQHIEEAYSEDVILHITLQKRDKGQTWPSLIAGQGQVDPYVADLEQKRLMLQGFQEENPGFDFSQAQFSGDCPDPRTFMGAISDELWWK